MKEVAWGPVTEDPDYIDPTKLLSKVTEGDEDSLPAIDPNEGLSVAEKARLYDEQIEAAEAVSSVLASLENVPGGDEATEEALIATLGLESDLLSLDRPRRISIFDMCIHGFSDMSDKDKENWRRISWMLFLSFLVIFGVVALVLYGEMTVVVLVSGAYQFYVVTACLQNLT